MPDVFKVADLLVKHVKSRFAKDVSIVAYYGSYVRGTARKDSDLDMFFIPGNIRGFRASFQFVLEGIGFDFWPIGWERAEAMADFRDSKAGIIADAKVLHSRSAGELKRFERLRARIRGASRPERGGEMAARAADELARCAMFLANIELPQVRGNLADLKMEADKLAFSATICLAYVNQVHVSAGWPEFRLKALGFERRPRDLKGLLATILRSRDAREIRDACGRLFRKTRREVVKAQRRHAPPRAHADGLAGFYEEIKSQFNKIAAACDSGDALTASSVAYAVQVEICRFLASTGGKGEYSDMNMLPEIRESYDEMGLPDLARIAGGGNLRRLKAAVAKLDVTFKARLKERGVGLNEFDSLGELARFLRLRKINPQI